MSENQNVLQALLDLYPKQSKILSYGTAGFRDRHDLPMHSVFVRMGILACLRSISTKSSCIGLMITASHNPEDDNGVKLIDADGGMLHQSWEPYAELLVNAATPTDVILTIQHIIKDAGIDRLSDRSLQQPVVLLGRDTRPHSELLSNCAIKGSEAFGGLAIDIGEVTTPQLHFIVQDTNKTIEMKPIQWLNVPAALDNYYYTLSNGYINLRSTAASTTNGSGSKDDVIVDCSYGVGSIALSNLITSMSSTLSPLISVTIRNKANEGPVNHECGAELVQKNQQVPCGFNGVTDHGRLLCSYDGDADRIVFHSYIDDPSSNDDSTTATTTATTNSKWTLFDGDKIAVLFALLLSNALKDANLSERYTLGIVQTAYANGASTSYLRKNNISITMAKTGVKYLHHKAQDYDLGIYFEANGHGTVMMSDRFLQEMNDFDDTVDSGSSSYAIAMKRLKACSQVINQAVGDAISDMLFVLAALRVLHLDINDWNKLYTDLPSKQIKVPVANKGSIVCSDDECFVVSPASLQLALNEAMDGIPSGRCFIRPSGTEDVVRVYAEADTQENADILAHRAIEIIKSSGI